MLCRSGQHLGTAMMSTVNNAVLLLLEGALNVCSMSSGPGASEHSIPMDDVPTRRGQRPEAGKRDLKRSKTSRRWTYHSFHRLMAAWPAFASPKKAGATGVDDSGCRVL